jgi:hypothetical protein
MSGAAPAQTSRTLLNTPVAALHVDRRRHAHIQALEGVELGLLAQTARGIARTRKPPRLKPFEAPYTTQFQSLSERKHAHRQRLDAKGARRGSEDSRKLFVL